MLYPIVRSLGIAALVISYPLMAHYTNTSTHNGNLGALVAIAPVVLVVLMLAKQSPLRLVTACVLVCAALWVGWSALTQHFGLVYWLQDAGLQLLLFVTFGRTLIAGRQPLCTRFAEMVHTEPLTPQHEAYARQVTVAWTVFFAAMTLTSTLLFFLALLTTWSLFANILTLPLIALMFIAEYGVRRWLLPDTQHTHILDAIRAFKSTSARPR
jgi:uncharacterized membrane protein